MYFQGIFVSEVRMGVLYMKYLLILLLFLCGCGKIEHDVKVDPIKVDPVTITHVITLDTALLYSAYQQECMQAAVDPTDMVAINKCADTKLNDFIAKFTKSI